MRSIYALAVVAMLAPGELAAQSAGAPAGAAAPAAKIRFEANPMIMCHFYLKTFGPDSVKPRGGSGGDFVSEATAYAQAFKIIGNPQVFRWFEERIASSGDLPRLRKATETLPASLQDAEAATGVRMLVEGMESAYPRYMETVYSEELMGINRVLISALKRWASVEERVGTALIKLMGFQPIDKEIVIYTVIRAGGVSTWGLSDKGYFTVIGVYGLSPSTLAESAVHEATHVLDAMQSYSAGTVLQEVRRGSQAADRNEIEVFLHGLVAFNAGELVKRFVNQEHDHAGVLSPAHAAAYRPYLSTYEFIWTSYMDGKIPRDGISKKLLEEFAAVKKLRAGSTGS